MIGDGSSLTRSDVEAIVEAFLKGVHENRDHSDNTLLPRKLQTLGPTVGAGYELQTGADGVAVWVPPTTDTLIDAKGDLLVGSAPDTLARLPVGANGTKLLADSAQTLGVYWAAESVNYLVDAKGDLLVGTADNTLARVAIAADGQRLIALASATPGVAWVSDATNYLVDAKGDLLAGTADNTIARVPVAADGQKLIALASATPGVAWAGEDTNYLIDAKGDLIAGTADNTAARVAVGANGKVLMADSSATPGVSWQPPVFVGMVVANPTPSTPTRWLAADGSSVLRASYPDLFAALCKSKGAVTVTLASPGVFTNVAHGLVIGDSVFVTTTGALPTGMSSDTRYYVKTVPTADTFTLGTTRAVTAATGAIAVTVDVNTSVSQSGVHTLWHAPWGVADSTHFTLPDGRSNGFMGRAAGGVLGITWGEATHVLTTAELAAHAHANTASAANPTQATSTFAGTALGTHNHTQDAHTHTQTAHVHGPGALTKFWNVTGGGGGTGTVAGADQWATSSATASTTAVNQNATATNQAASAGTPAGTITNGAITAGAVTMTNVNAGSDTAHNNVPPHGRVDWIIYAGA